ncbi:MAG: hypothetical protein ACT4P5_15560, partial [Armatimonadota bacterium]
LSTAQPTDDLLADAAALTEQHVSDPMTDVLADGEYRRAMAGVMVRRALARATRRAQTQAEGRESGE